ncbi:hypothetical protein HY3_13570 [Hyphomonas pacifica]|uniref:YCII-related domain-containing protein n=2 Tax=Hyphomonas pacifica TaxID=1280941 RepID=A0A8B2PV28_9PROT|nr:hypothetical protein HY3_13570 [Hyphomonas pacifica]RAN33725.1 hypothetical protein HY11_03270 [Hyphomonas pacifica]
METAVMQYALFLFEDESTFFSLSEDEQMAIVQEHMAFSEELQAAGAYVTGVALEPAETARCLKAKGDIEDGPFADTKEQMGGVYVINAGSMAEAEAWARKCPVHKSGGTIEIRPVPDYGNA